MLCPGRKGDRDFLEPHLAGGSIERSGKSEPSACGNPGCGQPGEEPEPCHTGNGRAGLPLAQTAALRPAISVAARQRKQHRAELRVAQQRIRRSLEAQSAQVVDSLDTVANGFIVRIPDSQAHVLSSIPGVIRVSRVHRARLLLDRAVILHRLADRWAHLAFLACSLLVVGLIGGILLVHTPTRVFDWLVPFLILFATILFMANATFSRFFRPKGNVPSRRWLWGAMAFQFAVALYGGYFGAGIGILMLASLGMLGFADVHEMNTVKTILGFLINIVAAVYFVMSAIVDCPSAGVMALGTIAGGYSGAHFAQKVDQKIVRLLITLIGLTLSALMFYRQFF